MLLHFVMIGLSNLYAWDLTKILHFIPNWVCWQLQWNKEDYWRLLHMCMRFIHFDHFHCVFLLVEKLTTVLRNGGVCKRKLLIINAQIAKLWQECTKILWVEHVGQLHLRLITSNQIHSPCGWIVPVALEVFYLTT